VPDVSFCITVMDRLDHLRRTLPDNIRDNPEAEFVVLDYNSKEDVAGFVKPLGVNYYRECSRRYYKEANAKNIAARLARGRIVCNLDADNFTGPGFAYYLQERMKPKTIFRPLWGLPSVGGRIALLKEDFLALGGYDETFEGFGWQDGDLFLRAVFQGFHWEEIPPTHLGFIDHDDDLRTCNFFATASGQRSRH
jgi:hypothetical protein